MPLHKVIAVTFNPASYRPGSMADGDFYCHAGRDRLLVLKLAATGFMLRLTNTATQQLDSALAVAQRLYRRVSLCTA